MRFSVKLSVKFTFCNFIIGVPKATFKKKVAFYYGIIFEQSVFYAVVGVRVKRIFLCQPLHQQPDLMSVPQA